MLLFQVCFVVSLCLAPEVSIRLKKNICFHWSTNRVRKYDPYTECVPWHERITIDISFQQVELGNVSS